MFTSAGVITGLFDTPIDGGITLNASSVTTWNHSNSIPVFTQLDAARNSNGIP